ncbi:MAG: hypothetical protein QGH74_00035 [Candidatus Brocadiia bacterium]|nr:hypothetical protein [Candidatus Brocadiia bacterium]
MRVELDGLRWRPRWVSHLGCLKGCLDYLGTDMSWAWLYGGTGHAFVINIHEVVCPSGPTAWNTEMLRRLAPNLGYRTSSVFGFKGEGDFASKQQEAWDLVRRSLDDNVPCYGWELSVPEYYAIHGYDDAGYYFSGPGCDEGAGPKPWRELGDSEIDVVAIHSVRACEPADDEKAVRDALEAVLKHARSPAEWIFPKYKSGPAGFDLWAEALDGGTAHAFGHPYNAAVWDECRSYAPAFLAEAKQRLGGRADSLFDEAIAHYTTVHSRLKAVSELHPFRMDVDEKEQLHSPEAAALVREAGAAERKGLESLQKLLDAVGGAGGSS